MLQAFSGNGPVDLTEARRLARRLSFIVRFAVIILAIQIEPAPQKPRRRGSATSPARRDSAQRTCFTLSRGWRRGWRYDDEPMRAQPEALSRARRDPVAAIKHKFEALSAALSDLTPLARRLARRLRCDLIVPGWRPPRRPPPLAESEGYEEQCALHDKARCLLREARRRWSLSP